MISKSQKKITIIVKGGPGDQLKHILGGLLLSQEFSMPLEFALHRSLTIENSLVSFFPNIPVFSTPLFEEVYTNMVGKHLSTEYFDGEGLRDNFLRTLDGTLLHILRDPRLANQGYSTSREILLKYPGCQRYILAGTRFEYPMWLGTPREEQILQLLRGVMVIPPLSTDARGAISSRRGDRVSLDSYGVCSLRKAHMLIRNISLTRIPSMKPREFALYTDSPKDFLEELPSNVKIASTGKALEDLISLAGHEHIDAISPTGFVVIAQVLRKVLNLNTSVRYLT